MSSKIKATDRDEVLFAFHQASARPTADQIIEWTSKYPQFAEDIRDFAAVSLEWEDTDETSSDEPTELELNRAFSNALNALHSGAAKAASAKAISEAQTIAEVLSIRGVDIPTLAPGFGGVGIKRSVLADLVNGGMVGPIGRRFRETFMQALAMTGEAFDSAFAATQAAPRLGHAKASEPPRVIPRSFVDVIKTSGMTADQIKYWLDED